MIPNVGKTNYRSGGTRGGRDQFSWENVKRDPYRDNFIGASLYATRESGNPDFQWWNKSGGDGGEEESDGGGEERKKRKRSEKQKKKREKELSKEKELVKQREEEMMAQALGMGGRHGHRPKHRNAVDVNSEKVKKALQRGQMERSDLDAERVHGLGIGDTKRHPIPSRNNVTGSKFEAKETRERRMIRKRSRSRSPGSDSSSSSSRTKSRKKKKTRKRKKKK